MIFAEKFPRAIIHIDGDAFFVGCELASKPWLRNKPVVTGKERGIASALNYVAKGLGLSRGMTISMMKKICPEVIVLPSDYETYSIYSERMYNIVKQYTPFVDEYGIDECFADITDFQQIHKMSYEDIAKIIKNDLDISLGMTFSVGLSVNKVLAKVGSKWNKPSGLTIIAKDNISVYLEKLNVGKIWGIGSNTSIKMNMLGIFTALDFANKSPEWVYDNFAKPYQEIHHELRGNFVLPLIIGKKEKYDSISKTRTFTPASLDKSYIFSQLSKNIENACDKLRRHGLFAKRVSFFLKTQEFSYHGEEIVLNQRTCIPQEILSVIKARFNFVYKNETLYRATGVTLSALEENSPITTDIFGISIKQKNMETIYKAVDNLSRRYGKHSVFLGSSFQAINKKDHKGDRGELPERNKHIFKGESSRKRIGIPLLGIVR